MQLCVLMPATAVDAAVLPWALMSVPIASLLSAGGDAFVDFTLKKAAEDRKVALLVAPDTMDTARGAPPDAGGCVLRAFMNSAGFVALDGAEVRRNMWFGEEPLARGETVRLRYVAATRMVSVVWRAREYELASLPAVYDLAHYRFGVQGVGATVRILAGSAAGARRPPCCVCADSWYLV